MTRGLGSVFESKGIEGLTGEAFIMTLGALAGGGPLVSKGASYQVREKRFGGSSWCGVRTSHSPMWLTVRVLSSVHTQSP